MIRAACHPTPIRCRSGRPSIRCASTSMARCSTRPMTTTSGATSCRNDSRLRMGWTCTPPMPRSRGGSRRCAARCPGIASNTGAAISASTSVRCIAKCRSHVAWLPGARDFLAQLRGAGKRLLLLTNSHPIALAVKHQQSGVLDYLDASATSHDFGHPKEHAEFWRAAVAHFGFDPARSLFVDDNSRMLDAARDAGIRWVYGVRHWDTRGARREHPDHPSVDSVAELWGRGFASERGRTSKRYVPFCPASRANQ